MCVSVSRQSRCYAIAIGAIFFGLLDVMVKSYWFVYSKLDPFIITGIVAWIPLLIASSMLLLGAWKERRVLVQISMHFAVFGGLVWIISSIGLLVDTLQDAGAAEIIATIISMGFFLALIGFHVGFAYVYLKELEW